MRSLGHERYLVAGGDWGASTAVRMAYAYPDAVQALHLYMMPLRRPADLAGVRARRRAPRCSPGARRRAATCTSRARGRRRSPTGSHDSPVGLMSWIAEKFDRWTDSRGLPPDDVLTTTMIYWTTGCIGSSFWPYWARLHGDWVLDDVAAAGDRHRRAAHVPRLPEGARPRAAHGRRARLRRRALGGTLIRRALPSAGDD